MDCVLPRTVSHGGLCLTSELLLDVGLEDDAAEDGGEGQREVPFRAQRDVAVTCRKTHLFNNNKVKVIKTSMSIQSIPKSNVVPSLNVIT